MVGRISELDAASKDRIHAEQIVKDVISVVKEMLDNSIDAGATAVHVELTDFGLRKIRVADNGTGMNPEDLMKLGRRGATSKILEGEEDLTQINFLGFRVI